MRKGKLLQQPCTLLMFYARASICVAAILRAEFESQCMLCAVTYCRTLTTEISMSNRTSMTSARRLCSWQLALISWYASLVLSDARCGLNSLRREVRMLANCIYAHGRRWHMTISW